MLLCVNQLCVFIVDRMVAIWDTRPPKGHTPSIEDTKADNPLGVSVTYKHLDLTWKPTLKVCNAFFHYCEQFFFFLTYFVLKMKYTL